MIAIILMVVTIVLLHQYCTRNHDYWVKRNVRHDRPLPFFGNHLPNLLLKRNNSDIGTELYKKYRREKIVGYFRGTTPELIIRDPEIIKRIFNSDFDFFPGRGSFGNKVKDPLMHNVIFTKGDEWRTTRQRMTPAFSPGKLRTMFPLLLRCTDKLLETVQKMSDQEEINTYDLLTRYPLEIIGSWGFGVELNTLKSEHSKFLELAKAFFVRSKLKTFLVALSELIPQKLISPKIVDQELEDMILNMTQKIQEQRKFKPSGRNDLMDNILEMQNLATNSKSENKNSMDGNFVPAQLFSILIGGFETTATAISFTLHQLAFHPEIQQNIQNEIDAVMAKHGQSLTYESIGELSLLEMAFKESMRLLSPFGGIARICAKSYTIPGTDVTIDAGIKIFIPTQALHMDPEYFESPEEFRPERFAPNADMRPMSQAYLAFGDGPRKCLGLRLAMLVSLAGLTSLLHRFTVAPGPSSQYKHSTKKSAMLIQVAEGDLPLRFTPRTK